MPQTTTTTETVTRYLRRAALLNLRARKDLGLAPSKALRAADLVAWAIDLRPRITPSTWRQYKAALSCALGKASTPESRGALTQLERVGTEACKRTSRNTSSQKTRALRPDDFKAIRSHLLSTGGKWARETLVWLAAGTVTGLRPTEWYGTKLIESPNHARTLLVPNGKNTNKRANGAFRSLDLTRLEPGLLAVVKRQLKFVDAFPSREAFHRARLGCRKTLYKATRTLWPKRQTFVCMYSARHQFAANAKAEGLSRPEVAALMGHATDATATLHYGRRTAGQSGFRIRPIHSEVLNVRRKAVSRAERLRRKAQSAIPSPSPKPTR